MAFARAIERKRGNYSISQETSTAICSVIEDYYNADLMEI